MRKPSRYTVAAAALCVGVAAAPALAVAPSGAAEDDTSATSHRVDDFLVPQPDDAAPLIVPVATTGWLSGASGRGASSGSFGRWRGSRVEIGGTWNDSYEAQTHQWTVQPGAEWGQGQNAALDVAVGAIYKHRGQTWGYAAKGAYDFRWRAALKRLKAGWGSRPQSQLYIRFAHEFNGDWMNHLWSVHNFEASNFMKAWRRFHAIQEEILPGANLVWSPNDGTSSSLRLDPRYAYPGNDVVDVIGVDSYNQYPWVNSRAAFTKKIYSRHSNGAPLGIETWRYYAQVKGKPFALPEWGTNFSMGDAPYYIRDLHRWFRRHAGNGPGKLRYEIYFNVENFGSGQFRIDNRGRTRAGSYYISLF